MTDEWKRMVKENIRDIENASSVIEQLQGVSFDWKETGEGSYGLIAQDVLKIPELEFLVDDRDGGDIEPMTIPDWSPLTALCIKSIQEQQVQINELKQTVNELKNLINTLV